MLDVGMEDGDQAVDQLWDSGTHTTNKRRLNIWAATKIFEPLTYSDWSVKIFGSLLCKVKKIRIVCRRKVLGAFILYELRGEFARSSEWARSPW